MEGVPPTWAEVSQLVTMLRHAGLLEIYTDERGRQAYRLTEDGVRIGHMLAMVERDAADDVLRGLLTEPARSGPRRLKEKSLA